MQGALLAFAERQRRMGGQHLQVEGAQLARGLLGRHFSLEERGFYPNVADLCHPLDRGGEVVGKLFA